MKKDFNVKSPKVHSILEVAAHNVPAQTPAPVRFAAGEKADVVIIGGGYPGLSAALHLALLAKEKGQTLEIVVLEAGRVGSGASGKSGGHVTPDFQEHDNDTVMKMFPDESMGQRALTLVEQGPVLVADLIRTHNIDCDMRDGYVTIDGSAQSVTTDGRSFGIEPYPYVLGLAAAARALGVKIYEYTPALDIVDSSSGTSIRTSRGHIQAKEIFCAGGQRMTETVPFLEHLRSRTFELYASTIMTDPLPPEVLKKLMPEAKCRRYPFTTNEVDIAYGTVDREGRIIFGAETGAFTANPDKIARKLFKLFPDLKSDFRKATGKDLSYRPLVNGEQIDFTMDLLPHVGRLGANDNIRYLHALGGHGIALGTILGKVAAQDIYGHLTKDTVMQQDFDIFTKVKHGWLPKWKPLRMTAAFAGVETEILMEKVSKLARKFGF